MKKDLVPIYQLEKENNKLESQNKEMLEFLVHLYANYELPYGAMDSDTKKMFKSIIEKYKDN